MSGEFLKKVLGSVEFLGIVLFVFCVAFPPFDDVTEVNLSLHMLQHVLIVVAGFMVAYPLLRRGTLSKISGKVSGAVCLVVVSALFVYWHLPGPWDEAVLNPLVHAFEHFSFFFAGFLIGSAVMSLSDSAKIGALILAFFGHMAYAVLLISPWSVRFYPLYSLAQQQLLGWILLVTGGVFLAGVAYIMFKNPTWLQGAGVVSPARVATTEAVTPGKRQRSVTAPILSVLLIIVLVGYFGATVLAISSAATAVSPRTAVVYIAETPVSWQYSPQNIDVVLGTNNTVTWVSHSISYDTVTGDNGSFSSGTIAPGASFTFTFTEPGKYEYHCAFHPWMVGTVTVLPA